MLTPAMSVDVFPLLLLLGRPASGKSEIIDYLGRQTDDERRRRFHLGSLAVRDDFPLLWSWLEEDALLERMGQPRLHSSTDGYFLQRHSWDVLVQMLCQSHDNALADDPGRGAGRSFVLEFSRGREHGGYRRALDNLTDAILRRAAILYVRVSFQESLRKNRRRFNPERPHSILEHGLSDEKMDRLYRDDDWDEVCAAPRRSVEVRGITVPAMSLENEDDVTTPRGPALGQRLEECLGALWEDRRRG